jgi:hypothetical protein
MCTDAVNSGAAREAVRAVLKDVIAGNPALSEVQGTAFFDARKDAIVQASSSFNDAKAAVLEIPNFVGRFGSEAADRIVLQLVFQYFKRTLTVRYDETQFEKLWCDFSAEVQDAYWIARGVANLRNFRLSDPKGRSGSEVRMNQIDLGDGVTIRGRSQTDLASLGFEEAVWHRITEDWHIGA